MEQKLKQTTIEVGVEVTGLDETIEKVEKLNGLLKEAKTLSDELASVELGIK